MHSRSPWQSPPSDPWVNSKDPWFKNHLQAIATRLEKAFWNQRGLRLSARDAEVLHKIVRVVDESAAAAIERKDLLLLIQRARDEYHRTGNPRDALRRLGITKGIRGRVYQRDYVVNIYRALISPPGGIVASVEAARFADEEHFLRGGMFSVADPKMRRDALVLPNIDALLTLPHDVMKPIECADEPNSLAVGVPNRFHLSDERRAFNEEILNDESKQGTLGWEFAKRELEMDDPAIFYFEWVKASVEKRKALSYISRWFDWPNDAACRQFLINARDEIARKTIEYIRARDEDDLWWREPTERDELENLPPVDFEIPGPDSY